MPTHRSSTQLDWQKPLTRIKMAMSARLIWLNGLLIFTPSFSPASKLKTWNNPLKTPSNSWMWWKEWWILCATWKRWRTRVVFMLNLVVMPYQISALAIQRLKHLWYPTRKQIRMIQVQRGCLKIRKSKPTLAATAIPTIRKRASPTAVLPRSWGNWMSSDSRYRWLMIPPMQLTCCSATKLICSHGECPVWACLPRSKKVSPFTVVSTESSKAASVLMPLSVSVSIPLVCRNGWMMNLRQKTSGKSSMGSTSMIEMMTVLIFQNSLLMPAWELVSDSRPSSSELTSPAAWKQKQA